MGTFLFAVIPFDLAVAIVYVAIAFTICTGLLERPRFMKESERKKYTTYPDGSVETTGNIYEINL